MKKILSILFFVLFLAIFTGNAIAASLALNSIGTSPTAGLTFSTWTHEGENPILVGEATSGESVSIKIDDLASSVTADASGEWTYTPTILTVGIYQVTITSGVESISFTLNITDSASSAASTVIPTTGASKGGVEAETLPESGSAEQTLLLLTGGLLLLGFGLMTYQQQSVRNS